MGEPATSEQRRGDITDNHLEARWRMDILNAYYRRDVGHAARTMRISEAWIRKITRDAWKNMSADERKEKADQYGATVEELDRVISGKRTPAKEDE